MCRNHDDDVGGDNAVAIEAGSDEIAQQGRFFSQWKRRYRSRGQTWRRIRGQMDPDNWVST